MSKSRVIAATVLLIGLASVRAASAPIRLSDFLIQHTLRDARLSASQLEMEASRSEMHLARLSYPTLRLDITSPTYSWRRSYTYQYYLDDLYRGYLESKDRIYRVSLSLRQPLPTGGNLSLKVNGHRYRTTFTYSGFPSEIPIQRESGDREFLADVGIELEQPLLGFLEARERARSSKINYLAALERIKMDAARSMRDGIGSFYGFLVSSLKVEIAQLDCDLARARLATAERELSEGIISEDVLLEKRIELAAAELALEDAKANLDQMWRALGVGQASDEKDLIPENLNEVAPVDTSSLRYELDPSVVISANEVELARITLAQTRRRRIGTPTLSIWYGFQGLGYSFREAREEFDRNRWGGSFSIGLTLPEPGLGNELKRARAKIRSAEAAYLEALDEARRRLDLARRRLNLLTRTLSLRKKRVELLQERLELKRKQRDEGLLSDEEFIKEQTDYLNARIAYLESIRDLDLAWLDICCATGENPLDILMKSVEQK